MVDFDTYCQPRKNPTENQIVLLLEEVNNECPKCGTPLVVKKKGNVYRYFEIAHVFPNSPTDKEKEILKDVRVLGTTSEDLDNKIALCNFCHNAYDLNKTVETYNEMLELKKEKKSQASTKHLLGKQDVEEDLVRVIGKLVAIDEATLAQIEELPKNVLTVHEKICDVILRKKVTDNVTSYFSYITNCFKNQGVSAAKYDLIRTSMKRAYQTAVAEGLSADLIFDKLTEWLSSKTNTRVAVCEVIISYFIQNCDIYGKSAE